MAKPFSYLDTFKTVTLMAENTDWQVYSSICEITRLRAGLSIGVFADRYTVEDGEQAISRIFEFLQTKGYVSLGKTNLWMGAIKDSGGEYLDTVVMVSTNELYLSVDMTGEPAELKRLVDLWKVWFPPRGTMLGTVSTGGMSGLDVRWNTILDKDVQIAKQSFYPWLSVPLPEYFQAFMECEEPILVMFGPPGTGKSTFLRSLIVSDHYPSMLAYNGNALSSPTLFESFYAKTDTHVRILACEDVDNFLGSREEGNTLMSSLLNASQGVMRHTKKKLILSTNLSTIDKIDPALLRVGRCFDILEFGLLTGKQAETARADVGMDFVSFSDKETWTLAEALAQQNSARQRINRMRHKVGFHS